MARPTPKWIQEKIHQDLHRRCQDQLAAMGVPEGHLLVSRVEMLDGLTIEYRVSGNSYPYRDGLKTAGFKWDSRGFWLRHSPPSRSAMHPIPIVGDDDCWTD